ncbi:MAG: hypothetical protein KAU28_00270, partial [Phycisphaerae bacterium]|nr:hypothetical protein [Phycisphaerae bacterium]
GNTLLKFHADLGSEFNKDGGGNALPAPKLVSLADIAAPVQSTDPADLGWYVADHSAEKYEAMLLRVENVTVSETGLGKARDNYELIGASGTCWASDYMNEAVGADYYHPYVEAGVHFGSATGILEQYTKPSSGLDYYQLLTTTSDDLVVPEPAAGIMLLCGAAALLRRRAARP